MPNILPKKSAAASFDGVMGDAVGDARDFVALVYCSELDEIHTETDRDHDEFTALYTLGFSTTNPHQCIWTIDLSSGLANWFDEVHEMSSFAVGYGLVCGVDADDTV